MIQGMASEAARRAHRRVIAAGVAGNVMEWYDFAVYGYFARTIGLLFFPGSDPTTRLIEAYAVFAVGFLMRPLGAVVFGYIGDRVGRGPALLWSVVAMAVPTASGIATVKDLLDKTKANPGKLNWASATATNEYLFAAYMKKVGLSMTKVPYKDSVQPINDLSEGRIDFYIGAYAIIRPHVQSGKVKILAVSTARRSTLLPDIPTLKETGIDVEADAWMGLIAPARTPDAVIARIHDEVVEAIKSPEVREKLALQLMEPIGNSPAEFRANINAEIVRWAPVIKAADIRIN